MSGDALRALDATIGALAITVEALAFVERQPCAAQCGDGKRCPADVARDALDGVASLDGDLARAVVAARRDARSR